jgi:hypothetical protein
LESETLIEFASYFSFDKGERPMLRSKLIPRKLNRNYFAIFLFLIVVFLTLNTAALAEEKNTWIAHSTLVVTKSETLKVNDNENHFVFFTEYDGVVFNDKGDGSFLDKVRYQVVYLGDTAGMVDGGYKIFTMPDGSQVPRSSRSIKEQRLHLRFLMASGNLSAEQGIIKGLPAKAFLP